ncbi:prevent-host-death family protein [Actinobacillus delphinicola]|uniref:type II toxin-antitoxin system Phd/YefM family antitoxin n=1 Tax=Actinobacillus delphinicola TaxID=51161 RepID=UPI0024411E15|nr:type II toxin-antitoxin system prevent-host-death family antitoxin [Actinobacillus delphinicola]MDG6898084.1 prevent-host-death family protein [Actinobacillus delphinicola]MDG6898091.1 prevent-host-death family protein [Actinobacillus delphinicola]
MNVVSYSALRKNLSSVMDMTYDNVEPILITRERSNKPSCVLMSLDEYRSLQETAYLLKNPEYSKRLLESIEEYKTGKIFERALIE